MTAKLAKLQAAIQEHILKGKDASPAIKPPPRGTARARLDVYGQAYGLRLTEFLAHDYPKFKCYLGETRFRQLAAAYIAAHPSDTPNARWYSRHLPTFLGEATAYRRAPELAELARLEQALNDAFDAADVPIMTVADIARIEPAQFGQMSFDLSPALGRFTAKTNVTSLWSSLRCDETPPAAERLALPIEVLVWRQAGASRFRILGAEEAMAVAAAGEGVSFAVICEMIAAMADPETAAARAASYLRGWIEAEIISDVRPARTDV
jgi:hypothetical protein